MSNTAFKIDNGLLVVGTSTLSGNVYVTANLVANSVIPIGNIAGLGSTTGRWILTANTGDFSSQLNVAGNLSVNSTALVVTSNTSGVRVGVGTNTPDATLQIAGTANISSNVYVGTNLSVVGNLVVNSTAIFVDSTTRRVRINSNNVSNTLNVFEVSGNTYFNGDEVVTGLATFGSVNVLGDLQVSGNLSYTGTSSGDIIPTLTQYSLGSSTDSSKRWRIYAYSASVDTDVVVYGQLTLSNTASTHLINGNTSFDSGVLFVDSLNNRIGINKTTPSVALDVAGMATITGNTSLASGRVIANTIDGNNTLFVSGGETVTGNLIVNTSVLVVRSSPTVKSVSINSTATDATLTVNGTANVIGNTNFSNSVFIAGNTQIGSGSSYILAKTDGSLRLTKELEVGNTSIYANTQTISTALSNTIVDTFYTSEYSTSKYVISYKSTSNTVVFGSTEILVMHNGSTVVTSEYSMIYGTDISFSVDAAIVGSNCNIYASANQGNLVVSTTRFSMV